MKSIWFTAVSTARRTAGLLNGAAAWFGRKMPISPVPLITSTPRLRLRASSGKRSAVGCSHQSISPDCSAADAVEASGMMCHSTRSKCATFGPAVIDGVPEETGT